LQWLNAAPPRLLVLLGTWALTVYLAHQPVLMGLLWLVKQLG
jgi:peptidoglycan/LPS O-acetylase OafA/YrhL